MRAVRVTRLDGPTAVEINDIGEPTGSGVIVAGIGSIVALTDPSVDTTLAVDRAVNGPVNSTGADTPTFRPAVDLPAGLQAGATTAVTVGLLGVDDDTATGSLPMVQVQLELDLVPEARGWVRIPRERHLLAPEDLPRRSFALHVAPAAPCGIVPGRLVVSVTSADGAGTTGQVRRRAPRPADTAATADSNGTDEPDQPDEPDGADEARADGPASTSGGGSSSAADERD